MKNSFKIWNLIETWNKQINKTLTSREKQRDCQSSTYGFSSRSKIKLV